MSSQKSSWLIFPLVNTLVFMTMFGVIGFYAFEIGRWILIGVIIGLGVGLIIEFGLGLAGGWIYRRRVILTVPIEIMLSIAFIGPFAFVYIDTTPRHHTVCCIETSGLGDEVEAVHIPVADGEMLAGWYAPPLDGSGAVVMVLHGSRGDRTGSLAHARVLHDAGYGVLVYDQRAAGESTGDQQSFGLYDRRDVTPLIDWLTAQPEVNGERIGGVGLSLGAQILIMAAPDEPRLKAIWSDGLSIHSVEDVPSIDGFVETFLAFVYRQKFWLIELYLGETLVPFKELIPQIAPRHLMLVAGGVDRDEATFNRGYEPYLGENGAVWIVERAGHVGGLFAEPETYAARMVDFFDDALHK